MILAQTLMVLGVNKQAPVATEWSDVIDHGGERSDPEFPALSTKRLPKQLFRA